MEYTYSKIEIASYLRDFVKILTMSIENPKIPFYKLGNTLLISEHRQQLFCDDYYTDMVEIWHIFLAAKIFELSKDAVFDGVKESDIKNINIPNSIFINPSDAYRFSKKQILKYIRNAFAHNKSDRELYKIKKVNDKIKVEISLLNTEPIPFNVLIDEEIIGEMLNILSKSKLLKAVFIKTKKPINFLNDNIEQQVLNNLYYRLFYLKSEDRDKLVGQITNNTGNEKSSEIMIKAGAEYKDFRFSLPQAVKINDEVKTCKISYGIFDVDNLTSEMIKSVIMPLCTEEVYSAHQIFDNYFINCYSNLNDAMLDISKKYKGKGVQDSNYISENIKNIITMTSVSGKFYEIIFNIYNQFMFDSLIKDETIKIGKIDVNVEKLRNSLVHSRWHGGANDRMYFYDWGNGLKNELDPNWKLVVKKVDLRDSIENYYQQLISLENNIPDAPIHFRFNRQGKSPVATDISFVRNGKGYAYPLDCKLKKLNKEKGVYISNGDEYLLTNNIEELNVFLKEIHNLTEDEKNNFKHEISEIEEYISNLINNFQSLEL